MIVSAVSSQRSCRHAPALEVAVAAHRSHQPRHARHRQAVTGGHRRRHAQRRSQDARGRPAREGSHRASASTSSRRRSGRAAASSSSAPARAAGWACSSRPRCRRPSGPSPSWCRPSWPAARTRCCAPREGVEDNYEEGARSINRLRPSKKDVVIGVSASGMTQFVRGALTRARRAGSKIIFVTCDPRTELQTFVDLDDRPRRGPRSHRRIDAAQGRHRDQDRAQHADDRRDGPHRQDVRQPDGGRADGIGEATRPRPPHRLHRHRPRRRRGRQAAAARALERQGRDRDAEEPVSRYPQALSRLRKAHDFVRDAIGEDAEARLRELLQVG